MAQKGSRKRLQYQKNKFSDSQIQYQIRDQIRKIRQKDINQVQQIEQIDQLYRKRKQQKKYKKMMEKGHNIKKNYTFDNRRNSISSQSDQPGEINENDQQYNQIRGRQNNTEQHVNIKQLGELIRQITLTRKKIIDLIDNRKFQILIKGCFVRYLSDSNLNKNDNYIIAQIIGVGEGKKEYSLIPNGTQKTKLVLKLQETSEKIIQLPITMVSNQSKKQGSLEIQKWLETNRQKAPKQKQLREKLQQHNRLLTEQLSSQQIDKNIQNRAIAISKGQQQPKEDIQNLIDFISQKIDNYDALQEEQLSKRKQEKLELIQIRRKKLEYQQIRNNLEEKKRKLYEQRQTKNIKVNNNQQNVHTNKDGLKQKKAVIRIEQKRDDEIRQKWRLREMMLCTAEGYERVKLSMLENHNKFEIEFDF